MGWASKLVNNPAVINALKGVKADASAAPATGGATTVTRAPGRGLLGGRLAGLMRGRGGFKAGGKVSSKSASARADGIATKGKTKGKII